MMQKRSAFTLIELLVVIAIIALLMAILMPALQRVRKQARTVACLSLQKQWSLYFKMYTDEYDGYFMEGFNGRGGSDNDNRWVRALGSYHKWEDEIACCPNATKPWQNEDGSDNNLAGTFLGSTTAWGYYQQDGWLEPFKGSYGINGWCNNPDPGHSHGGKPEIDHWRSPNVKGAAYVPLFLAAQRYNIWPEHTDPPPTFDGQIWSGNEHMARVCLNRHNGFVNCLFLDWSARKVGLKELWTLKWHRSYNTVGPYTKAGGVIGDDWPVWMRNFKDY
jgi:prepilin-type N-terminal cleavage/methylation domain-containing protein/prepilin-type processing-associated H-X9-DG protein